MKSEYYISNLIDNIFSTIAGKRLYGYISFMSFRITFICS